jgi:hypothetical protein
MESDFILPSQKAGLMKWPDGPDIAHKWCAEIVREISPRATVQEGMRQYERI